MLSILNSPHFRCIISCGSLYSVGLQNVLDQLLFPKYCQLQFEILKKMVSLSLSLSHIYLYYLKLLSVIMKILLPKQAK